VKALTELELVRAFFFHIAVVMEPSENLTSMTADERAKAMTKVTL
jgi:hypothetical protein